MLQKTILEIRAGTGGDEAALFAADLARMYQKYAAKSGWSFFVLDYSQNALGGYKTFVAEAIGEGAYVKLKNESGVHRIQRIPKTEKSGRIHTSTASVAVLEEKQDVKLNINPSDLAISFFRSSGPGGQNVNKVETGVRIIHKPSGVVVASQVYRSQHQNREKALSILQTKLYEHQKSTVDAAHAQERRDQIGTAERAEKIRTYNIPQDRITDHRIGKSWSKIGRIIVDGDLGLIVRASEKKASAQS